MDFTYLFIMVMCSVVSGAKDYADYKVLRIYPETDYQHHVLRDITDIHGVTVWGQYKRHAGTDIMVSPDALPIVDFLLFSNNMTVETIIPDVGRLENQPGAVTNGCPPSGVPSSGRRGFYYEDDRPSFNFQNYQRYDVIEAYLKYLAETFPSICRRIVIGQSFEGRNMTVLHISNGFRDNDRPIIFIDAGVHAREWVAPAMALYIIHELVEKVHTNRHMLYNVDWYILPLVNPDGYEYSHTTDRYWRKTRSVIAGTDCLGADANRNWDFHWMLNGASTNPCKETYAGPAAFSEVEARNLRDFGMQLAPRMKLYLTLHAYGPLLLYPWGYTSALPKNDKELQELGEEVTASLEDQYDVGSSTRVLYEAAGGSDDYFMAMGKVDLSYTMELPGGGSSGFDLPPERIYPVVVDTFKGIRVFAAYIRRMYGRSLNKNKVHRRNFRRDI